MQSCSRWGHEKFNWLFNLITTRLNRLIWFGASVLSPSPQTGRCACDRWLTHILLWLLPDMNFLVGLFCQRCRIFLPGDWSNSHHGSDFTKIVKRSWRTDISWLLCWEGCSGIMLGVFEEFKRSRAGLAQMWNFLGKFQHFSGTYGQKTCQNFLDRVVGEFAHFLVTADLWFDPELALCASWWWRSSVWRCSTTLQCWFVHG